MAPTLGTNRRQGQGAGLGATTPPLVRSKTRQWWPLLCFWLMASAARGSAATLVPIGPPGSQLGYTVFALGFMPMEARFGDFAGTLTIDKANAKSCAVQVTVRVASLRMVDPGLTRLALGPAVLDAARFPSIRYVGHCQGSSLVGLLTLHGVTRPFTFTVTRDGTHAAASGMLRRQDFGIGGLGGLIAERVRFQLDAALPPSVAPR